MNNKVKSIFSLPVILLSLICLSGCQNNKSTIQSKRTVTKKVNKYKVFPVKINNIEYSDRDEFIVKGTTKAPNGYKIMAYSSRNTDNNVDVSFKIDDRDDSAQVKNGKFITKIYMEDLTAKENFSVGMKLYAKIFAINKIPSKDYEITNPVKLQIKNPKFKETEFTLNSKSNAYLQSKLKKEHIESTVDDYEDNLNDELEDYDPVDDPEVKLKNDIIYVDVKFTSRSLLFPAATEQCLVPILKAAKSTHLDPSIKYIKARVYGDSKKDYDYEQYSIESIKQVNWKKVSEMDNDDMIDFFVDFSKQQDYEQ